MSPDRHKRVQEVFLAVLELPREQAESVLRERCGDDASMVDEVRSLLGFHAQADQFLDAREIHVHGIGDLPPEEVLKAGVRVGEYTIQRLIGAGGMGHVYVAEQDRPRRTVALKIIRRGVATHALLRRFEHEAEMLGRLQHPGIAQIHEAGAAIIDPVMPAQPFIAMELVDGPSLTAYAEAQRCDCRAKLDLIARVCDAVHHAHQRGVIHRDLKPANILVAQDGQPKVLDFGVARAADTDLRVTTMHTSVGQLIGTLPYMSPEQVIGNPAELDTRSDVYALGVVMYELLTGRLPYELGSRALPEAVRLIRDQPPARLSAIDRTLRGDIDTIVSKALAKEKDRRYQSAADLAGDIRAFLEGRPIAARQDSALYVLRKQMRRHKVAVTAAALMLVGVLAFAVYAIMQARTSRMLELAARDAQASAESALAEASQRGLEAQRQLATSTIERGRLLALAGNTSAAEDLLWPEYLKDLGQRRLFYALWELYSRSRCEAMLEANQPAVLRVAVSPDGQHLVTTGTRPGVIVWDTRTYEPVARFGDSGVAHTAVAFLPRGDLIIGDASGRLTMWEPRNDAKPIELPRAGGAVVELGVCGDGRELVVVTASGRLMVLRLEEGGQPRVMRRVHLRGTRLVSAAIDAATDQLALGCGDGHVRLLSLPELVTRLEIADVDDTSPRVSFSADGTMVAACGRAQGTRAWRSSTGQRAAQFRAPNGAIHDAAFTPDGRSLVSIGWWWVQLWSVADQRLIASFSHTGGASDLTISPDGRYAWAVQGSAVRAWELDPRAGRVHLDGAAEGRSLARFVTDDQLLVGDRDGSVRLLDAQSGEQIARLGSMGARVRAITISPTRPLAVAITWDGTVGVFDLEKRERLARWTGYRTSTYTGASFDSSGERIVLATRENGFRVVHVPSGRVDLEMPPRPDTGEALMAAFSPDGSLLAMSSRRGGAWLCDARTGAIVRELQQPSGTPWTILFTPDGRRVVSGTWARTIDVWDVASGRLDRRLDGHRGLVTELKFRPGEPMILASSGGDGRVMLWDLSIDQNTPVMTLDGGEGWEFWSMDFDRSGRKLVATNAPGTSIVWNLRYFNRHIGGNMLAQIHAHRDSLGEKLNEPAALDQLALLLNRGGKPRVSLPTDDPVIKAK